MGEYMMMLTDVRSHCLSGERIKARDALKRLLNALNLDYMGGKTPEEKGDAKKAIESLLPVLQDIRAGSLSPRSKELLQLDPSFSFPSDREGTIPPPSTSKIYGSSSLAPSPQASEPAPSRASPAAASESKGITPATPSKKAPKNGSNNPLMPLLLTDYIGQEKAKRLLDISIKAAKKSGRPLQHLLIASHYGLGKTTLANIIANEMGLPFFEVNATSLKDVKALTLYFSKISESCLIFIDEIHTLKKDVQTVLLSIMTDFAVNYLDEEGETHHFDLSPFTLVGASTQPGELLKPFLNRFAVLELEDYAPEELKALTKSKFRKLGYAYDEEVVEAIACRSRGVPRTIETYVKGVSDVALASDHEKISLEDADVYFEIQGIDSLGLGKNDRRILETLDESDRPLALTTLEGKVAIQREDIEFRYEPYLIQIGFVEKTPAGRAITPAGRRYLHPEEDPAPESAPELTPSEGGQDPLEGASEGDEPASPSGI